MCIIIIYGRSAGPNPPAKKVLLMFDMDDPQTRSVVFRGLTFGSLAMTLCAIAFLLDLHFNFWNILKFDIADVYATKDGYDDVAYSLILAGGIEFACGFRWGESNIFAAVTGAVCGGCGLLMFMPPDVFGIPLTTHIFSGFNSPGGLVCRVLVFVAYLGLTILFGSKVEWRRFTRAKIAKMLELDYNIRRRLGLVPDKRFLKTHNR